MKPSEIKVGDVFGKLTVISREGRKNNATHFLCHCSCDALKSEIVSVPGSRLINGITRACQNCSGYKYSDPEQGARNQLLLNYKAKARQYKREWLLTDEQAIIKFKGNCVYCGRPPSNIKKSRKSQFVYNGIDRINNEPSYKWENTVSCCERHNFMKGGKVNLTGKEFIEDALQIARYNFPSLFKDFDTSSFPLNF